MSSTPFARDFRAAGFSNFRAAPARILQGRTVSRIDLTSHAYTSGIATALRADYAHSTSMVKEICEDTGASVGTVKNWLAETNGPGGEHLVKLLAVSPSVRGFVDQITGRADAMAKAEQRLRRIAQMIESEDA